MDNDAILIPKEHDILHKSTTGLISLKGQESGRCTAGSDTARYVYASTVLKI